MTAVVIDTENLRSLKGLLLAANADTWMRVVRDGTLFFRVPSETQPGVYYQANETSCSCYDSQNNHVVCKHSFAVRLFIILQKATEKESRRAAALAAKTQQ